MASWSKRTSRSAGSGSKSRVTKTTNSGSKGSKSTTTTSRKISSTSGTKGAYKPSTRISESIINNGGRSVKIVRRETTTNPSLGRMTTQRTVSSTIKAAKAPKTTARKKKASSYSRYSNVSGSMVQTPTSHLDMWKWFWIFVIFFVIFKIIF